MRHLMEIKELQIPAGVGSPQVVKLGWEQINAESSAPYMLD